MDTDFTDIKIVGIEEEMTVESPENPSLRYIFLVLSQTPLPIWQSHFKDLRKISRHPHWRRAWVDRKFIVVECLPAEIEKYHLRDLKNDVAEANRRSRGYLQGRVQVERQKQSADANARDLLREMKNRLNFD